jgi:hypothetical protein
MYYFLFPKHPSIIVSLYNSLLMEMKYNYSKTIISRYMFKHNWNDVMMYLTRVKSLYCPLPSGAAVGLRFNT